MVPDSASGVETAVNQTCGQQQHQQQQQQQKQQGHEMAVRWWKRRRLVHVRKWRHPDSSLMPLRVLQRERRGPDRVCRAYLSGVVRGHGDVLSAVHEKVTAGNKLV
jgi:hypothetical protein